LENKFKGIIMKTTIKVKVLTPGCMPTITEKGDWIDLRASKTMLIDAPQYQPEKTENYDNAGSITTRNVTMNTVYIPLGVAIKLPDGYEAIVASRSGTPRKLNMFIPNGIGIIDNCYNGNSDEWQYIGSAMKKTHIEKGDRICQFRIQLSQKATLWQKIKWLFSSGVKLVEVDNLNESNRGMNVTGI
jgi:dUTP pyrophosphatase